MQQKRLSLIAFEGNQFVMLSQRKKNRTKATTSAIKTFVITGQRNEHNLQKKSVEGERPFTT